MISVVVKTLYENWGKVTAYLLGEEDSVKI
jgi:hypothetical protein